jgi:hypothetical protein
MNFKKITSSSDAVLTGRYRISKVRLVAGTDAATAILLDGVAQSGGTDFCKLSANSAGDTDKENFGHNEGVQTSKGLSVTLSGTNSILYIYYL